MNYIAMKTLTDGGGGVNNLHRMNESNSQSQQQGQQNIPRLIHPQACIFCHKSSVCVCQRCGDFYCSPECQRRDWPRHRYICMPMPQLVQASYHPAYNNNLPVLNEINQNSIKLTNGNQKEIAAVPTRRESICVEESMQLNKSQQEQKMHPVMANNAFEYPKNNSCVMLTGFRSPNRCFIRSLLPSDNEGYLKIFKTINDFGKTAPKLTDLPRVGDYAITTFKSESTFHRVEILAVKNPQNIRVLYIDYGNTMIKKCTELRKINEEIIRLKKYVVPIALKDVPYYNYDDKLVKFLFQFENYECRVEYQKSDDRAGGLRDCILKSWNTNHNINEEIIKFANSEANNVGVRNFDKDASLESETKDDNKSTADRYRKSQPMKESRELVSDRLERHRTPSQIGKNKSIDDIPGRNRQPQPPKELKEQQSKMSRQQSAENIPDALSPHVMPKSNEKKAETEENVKECVEPKKTLPNSPLASQKPVLDPPFEIIQFKKNDVDFQVISLDTSMINMGCFGCLALTDFKIFKEVQGYVSTYKDTERPYRPVLNEYCLAKFEGEWYRAKVNQCSSDLSKFTVSYIDFTNESVVTPKEIRRYPDDLTLSCCSNLCMIEGLPEELNQKQIAFLQNKLEGFSTTHKITKVIGIEDNVPIVQMDELIAELRAESLL